MQTITITKKYVRFIKDGATVSKSDSLPKGQHPLGDEKSFEETDDVSIYESWKLSTEPVEPSYTPTQFIAWAISAFPAFIGTPHEYVVVQFGMDPAAFKDLMLERAQIIDTANGNTDFTDIANALIAKAIELGAEI